MKGISVLAKRHYKAVAIVILFGSSMVLSGLIDGAYESYGPKVSKQLTIVSKTKIPLTEISGIHLRDKHIVIVGDTRAQLITATMKNLELTDVVTTDFTKAITEQFAVCTSEKFKECRKQKNTMTSQWEAVGSDGSGRFFLLNEQLSTIFVLNPTSQHIDSLINLDGFSPTSQSGQPNSKEESNALAEGFVLLNNGHILVVKERFPPSIVEFAPEGEVPKGYSPALQLKSADKFLVSSGKTTMKPLKVWLIPKEFGMCDLSELADDQYGNLFVMSQKCRWIAQLDNLNLASPELHFRGQWSMPAEIKHGEALAVIDSHTFLVANDRNSKKADNIFLLKRADS